MNKHIIDKSSISTFFIGFLILMLSVLYGGRNNVFVLIFVMIPLLLNRRHLDGDVAIILLLLCGGYVFHIFGILTNGCDGSVLNLLNLYIPFILYIGRYQFYNGFKGMHYIICVMNVFVNSVYIFNIILFGYTRETVHLLGASVNLLASINVLFICYHLFVIREEKDRRIFWTSNGLLIVSVICILLTLSRSMIAITIIVIISYYAYLIHLQRKKRSGIQSFFKVIAFFSLIGIGGSVLYQYLINNSRDFKRSVASFTYYFEIMDKVGIGHARTVLWGNALEKIQKNLFFGSGSSKTISSLGEALEAHNFILEILLLGGVFGMVLYCIAYFWMFRSVLIKLKRECFFFLLIISAYYTSNLFQPFISSSYGYNMLFGWIFVTMVVRKERKEQGNDKKIIRLLHAISGV